MNTNSVRRRKGKAKRQANVAHSIFDEVPDLKIARRLWASNKRLEAANLFLQTVDENPSNVPSLIDASRALGELFNYAKAQELLETVVAVGARSSRANYLAGQSYRMLRRFKSAEVCFTKAIELDDRHVDARLELAIIFERSGRLEEATEQLRQRQKRLAEDSESCFLLARIQRRQGELETARKTLEKLTVGNVHPLTKIRCHCELSKLLEKEHQFQAAWQSMLAAKSLEQRLAPTNLEQRRKRIANYHRLSGLLTRGHLDRWQERANPLPKQRSALLTGLPRSGTTLLAKLLHGDTGKIAIDEHPAFARFCLPWFLGSVQSGISDARIHGPDSNCKNQSDHADLYFDDDGKFGANAFLSVADRQKSFTAANIGALSVSLCPLANFARDPRSPRYSD